MVAAQRSALGSRVPYLSVHGRADHRARARGDGRLRIHLRAGRSRDRQPHKEQPAMNHLLRDFAPVTDEAWRSVEDEARRTLAHFLTARRLVDFEGPLGWDHDAV